MHDSDWQALTRRASLKLLGSAGLPQVFAIPGTTAAKRHGRNRRKNGDPRKFCKRQATAWTDLVTAACQDIAEFQDELACATPLKSCDFGGFLACFFAGQEMVRPIAGSSAGLAAFASSIGAEAQNKKSAVKKKAKQKCQRQEGQCTSFLIPGCEGDPTCLANVERCCAFAGSCDVSGFVECALGG